MKKRYALYLMFFLGLAISITAFVADLFSPYGYAVWLVYILPVILIYHHYLTESYTYFFASLNTLLILSKFIIASESIPGISIFNRIIFVIIMWIVSYIQIQRKRANDGMNESQERLQTMADSMPQMIWTTSADGKTDYINKKWTDYTGLSIKDVIGTGWLNVFHPDDMQAASDAWMQSVRTGEKYEIPARLKRLDGQYFWHLNRAISQKNGAGKIIKWYGTSTDMSEMMRLEEKVNIFAKRFQVISESNIVGIVIADLDGIIYEANDYYLDILGVTRKDFEENKVRWDTFTPPEYLPLDYKAVEELRTNGICTPYEKEYYTKQGGRKWVLLHDVMLPGEKEQVLAFVLDITIRKNALKELSDSKQKLDQLVENLERSNRELEQFAYIASHDLNEPLRMITNYLGLFLKNYGNILDEKALNYLSFPIDSAKRMSILINDLLTFSRVTSKPQPLKEVNMNKVLEIVLADLQDAIASNQAKIVIDPLPVIEADEVQMRQLFQNLISNAIKFKRNVMPEICIRVEKRRNEWVFEVQDNGIGISPEYYDKVFQIFQRLHDRETYPGTGIGLAVCKKIIERHNGRIWIESEQDKGSIFYFSIPAKK